VALQYQDCWHTYWHSWLKALVAIGPAIQPVDYASVDFVITFVILTTLKNYD